MDERAGQQTRIALRDDGGASTTYELTSSYTQVADPYEPNDGRDAAAPMPDGGQMSAFLFAGRRGGTNDPAAYDDYYRFTAQPGPLSIRLDDVPGDLAARLFLSARTAARSPASRTACVGPRWRSPAGGDGRDGLRRPRVAVGRGPGGGGAGAEVPASFTQPYG